MRFRKGPFPSRLHAQDHNLLQAQRDVAWPQVAVRGSLAPGDRLLSRSDREGDTVRESISVGPTSEVGLLSLKWAPDLETSLGPAATSEIELK